MIQFVGIDPNGKYIELGGGANPQFRPNVDVRQCFDPLGNPTVDFTANFEDVLPIQSNEWDGVFSHFVIEHISWRKLPFFLAEMFRILKPGGKVAVVTANTGAQIEWLRNHPEGWDGKGSFDSFSCILFGDQDYSDNTHKNFLNPAIAEKLFRDAGFGNMKIEAYGERDTDMVIIAQKPQQASQNAPGSIRLVETPIVPTQPERGLAGAVDERKAGAMNLSEGLFGFPVVINKDLPKSEWHMGKPLLTREEMFDKHYFNGGKKVGGYMFEGYRDFPVHEITARKILERKPESVLELGAARGYVLKRIQDAGVKRACGLEISKHCYMTRAADGIRQQDLCKFPWDVGSGLPMGDERFDLCYSVAVLEHIPEEHLPKFIAELERVSKRGLHGVDFGEKDDGCDKTHCTLKPKSFWQSILPSTHEVIDKEELEWGSLPEDYVKGDGKLKIQVGSFTTMYHHGWINIDIHDLAAWATHYGYQYLKHDVRLGLPYATGSVDLIACCHMLEHLDYKEGLTFLRECRRVMKPGGVMRIQVPDTAILSGVYWENRGEYTLDDYGEINDECANAKTRAVKYHALLQGNEHKAFYDSETLGMALGDAGFRNSFAGFRESASPQMLRETLDTFPCLTLFAEGIA